MKRRKASFAAVALGSLAVASPYAMAGAHTWDVNELFTNASGTIMFIELRETGGGNFETGVGGHLLTSNTKSFTIPSNVSSPTGFKTLLFATAAFAALPGAPAPDHIIPVGSLPFFNINGDTITYVPYDPMTFGPGQMPTDGVHSLTEGLGVTVNSPRNYAGQTGTVNANPPPPAVPDGDSGGAPMMVTASDVPGSSITISWDTATCSAGQHHLVYGNASGIPTVPGGTFTLTGSVCGMGASSPFTWSPAPDSTDGRGLIWWLILATDGVSTEGSWGHDNAGAERVGPGPNGSSAQCGMTTKSLANTCGM